MAFVPVDRSSRRRVSPPGGRVWAIGSRAYVHGPAPTGAVVLTDEFARVASMSLDDGVEVEVRAWRPRGSAGARYHVRALDPAVEGWLGAEHLRMTREVPPPPPSAPAAPVSDAAIGRRFGQR